MRSDRYLPNRVLEGSWFLLKIHGCVSTPEDIILDRGDYRKALFEEPLREVLGTIFKTYQKFWIGYGHNDPTLDFLVDENRERLNLNGGFAIAKKGDHVLESRFKDADILPSWVDDYSQIPEFLRKLAEATDSRLIFEIIIKCEWSGEKDAESYGNRILEALSRLGGDFSLFRVETGSIRLYIETKASNLADLHKRIEKSDPEILEVIKKFNILSFDGLSVENLICNRIFNMEGSSESTQAVASINNQISETKHIFPIPHQIPPPPEISKAVKKK
jgi:hypothetical protein